MGRINITWITSAPAPRSMGEGNVCFLCSGNAPSNATNPQIVTKSNYTSYLTSTRWEYTALQSYFKNAGSPTNTTRLYWMGAGSATSGFAIGTGLTWYIKYGPFDTIDSVYIEPTGGTNWQALATYHATTCESGYIAQTGLNSKYNGYVEFSGQFISGVDQGGPYFESGGSTFSGQEGRDIMSESGGRILINATRNSFGIAAQAIVPLDVQFVCPVYDTTVTGVSGCAGILGDNTGSIEDLRNVLGMCPGNNMMAVWAMPSKASLNTVYHNIPALSGSPQYQNIRDYVGQDKNAIVIYADVATGTNGTGSDDPAAAYLGRIIATPPHETMMLKPMTISLNTRCDENAEAGWKAGQIACIIRATDLGFDTDQLSYGFTFAGTTPENRLNNVRCKYQVIYNVQQDLWSMLSTGKVRVSKSGLSMLIDTLKGTLRRMEKRDIIDKGEQVVTIPLMNGTDAEWTSANKRRVIDGIQVRWTWLTSPEELNITHFGEIL